MAVVNLSEKDRRHFELEYSYNIFPDDKTKSALAQLTGLATEEVSKWFEAQRQKSRTSSQQTLQFPLSSMNIDVEPGQPTEQNTSPGSCKVSGLEEPRELRRELPEEIKTPEYFHNSIGGELSTHAPNNFPGQRLDRIESIEVPKDFHNRLEYRSTRKNTSALSGDTDSGTPASTMRTISTNSERTADRNHSLDEMDYNNESSLPGYSVFTASGERLGSRRRKRFDSSTRQQVAMVRKVGACLECRMRKVRCRHVLNDQLASEDPSISISTSHDPLPPFMKTSKDIQDDRSQTSHISQPAAKNIRSTGSPTSRARSQESERPTLLSEQQSVIEQGDFTLRIPVDNVSTSIHHLTLPPQPPHHPTQSDSSSNTVATSAHDPHLVCHECGFRPVGELKWRKSNLMRHMRVRHPATGKHTIVCPVQDCGKVYTRSDNLRIHIKRAHGEEMLASEGKEHVTAEQPRPTNQRNNDELMP